jgi:2',3'-cyclic-nucleotide 2'-phosphodiesterase (5'-nucleotidase family)
LENPKARIWTITPSLIGGHSHTLLGQFPEAAGPYPTIETNLDGEEVFIVTAWRWGQVLGYINVAFESGPSGRVLTYAGGPIPMDKTIKQDPALQAKVDVWRKPFDDYAKEVVGVITDRLDATKCQQGECKLSLLGLPNHLTDILGTLGNYISDAILDYRLSLGAKVDGAIMNAGQDMYYCPW